MRIPCRYRLCTQQLIQLALLRALAIERVPDLPDRSQRTLDVCGSDLVLFEVRLRCLELRGPQLLMSRCHCARGLGLRCGLQAAHAIARRALTATRLHKASPLPLDTLVAAVVVGELSVVVRGGKKLLTQSAKNETQ